MDLDWIRYRINALDEIQNSLKSKRKKFGKFSNFKEEVYYYYFLSRENRIWIIITDHE